MKERSSGKSSRRVNAKVFMQNEQEHYNSSSINTLVENNSTIRVTMTLFCMTFTKTMEVIDINRHFTW